MSATSKTVITGGLAVGLIGLAAAPPASAHDWLVSSNPAPNSTVTSVPAQIKLSFDAPVLIKPAPPLVDITGPDGRHYATACATALGDDVTVPWQVGPQGKYTVTWRIVSDDGHPVGNSMSFTYRGHAGARKGQANALKCDSSSGSSHTGAIVAGSAGAGIVILGVLGTLLYRRRGTSSQLETDDE